MSTREAVLAALRDAGDRGISGEELASGWGVSRVAVGKHVAALREAGYLIEAIPGRGYRLLGVPDAPLPAEVRRSVRSGMWSRLEGEGATASTNADAARLARDGVPHGTAVLASAQTEGKGRLGRVWDSPEGGVYVSGVLRPPLAPGELTALPLAVAWGVAEELGQRFSLAEAIRVKWPNDLLLAGVSAAAGASVLRDPAGKLAGVLLEISGEADRTAWVVAGVGVNVDQPARPVPGAAYLADAVGARRDIPKAEVAAAVLDGISRGYHLLADRGPAALREAVESYDALRGETVEVRDIGGRLLVSGIAEGIDDLGRLVVRDGDDDVAVTAGDVTLAGVGIRAGGDST